MKLEQNNLCNQLQIIAESQIFIYLFIFVSRRHSLSSTKLLSPHSSGEDEEQRPEGKQAMCNREIVRRGALILFCDYVVRLYLIESYSWRQFKVASTPI